MFSIDKNQEQVQNASEQSYFYKLYQQKIKDLKEINSSLALDIDNSDEMMSEDSNKNICYTDLVAKTLNLPHTQVYLQASTNPVGFEKMLEKAKRQIRRLKAKDRKKQGDEDSVQKYNHLDQSSDLKCKIGLTSTTQTSSGDEKGPKKKLKKSNTDCIVDGEGEQSKRQIQMIRNRMSAQSSRDRKKLYINKLEEDAEQMEGQNLSLKSQLYQLQQQMKQIQHYNNDLQNQLKELSQQYQGGPLNNLICADCQGKNVVYDCDFYGSQPSLSKKRSANFSHLSLAFLAVITMIAIVASPPAFGTTNLSQTSLQLQNNTCVQKKIDGIKYYDRVVLQGDSQYDILNKISQFPQTKLEESSDEPFAARKNVRQNRKQNKNQLATLDYFKDDNSVSTIYCPNSFKYQDFSQNEIGVTFETNQWIHLLVPKNNITLFYVADQVIMTRERAKQQRQSNRSQMSEIWCQVKSVNELFME